MIASFLRKVPSTFDILSSLVTLFQSLTLAVAPLVPPVITSLNWKFPDASLAAGGAIDMVGVYEYPDPAFIIWMALIVPAALTIAVAAAETVGLPENVIAGLVVYPEPPPVTVTIPIDPDVT